MKAKSEKRIEKAVKQLLKYLERKTTEIGLTLNDFEITHGDYECCYSKQYNALNAGYFSLKETIEKINYQLNKRKNEDNDRKGLVGAHLLRDLH